MRVVINQYLTNVLLSCFVLVSLSLSSCSDDYEYDNKEPDNLGASIYGYLENDGGFTYFLRLIDDLEYRETLSRTGSKTLFPARDDAFERFFMSNPYGVSSYEELTASQKRGIMNSSMINMAYLSDMLPNVAGSDGATEGLALRRYTECSNLDSIAIVEDEELFSNKYWSRFQGRSVMLAQQAPMIVHFTEPQMKVQNVSESDFSILYNGKVFMPGDIYVNGIKVVEKDVLCKNGYVHVLEDVLVPARTMADAVANAPESKIFNRLLNKFSAPYYDGNLAQDIYEYYNGSTPLRPLISPTDSIFVKEFFNERTRPTGPHGESLSSYGLLYYDPADAGYSGSSAEQDMGAMFVPTDKAMEEFFNGGKGQYLKDAYGSWENIPTDILALFIKNHQKRSFTSSLPHSFDDPLTDETSYPYSISTSNIERCEITNNGAVYFINTVLPPIDYQGVYGSVLTADDTKVMKWALTDDWSDLSDTEAMRFYMYLRSMENMYNLLVPTDAALQNYREPISWARGGNNREIWSFIYDPLLNVVTAEVYRADENGNKGEYLRKVSNKRIIRNRLRDIVDMHIVVGNNEEGMLSGYINEGSMKYALTKGGSTIRLIGEGDNFKVAGGGDDELNMSPANVITNELGQLCKYDSDNGRTFFIDGVLHDPTSNVYGVLESHPDFKAFFDLCRGHDQVFTYFSEDEDVQEIFSAKIGTSSSGIGMVVNSFNNFRYTIFVPTEDAIREAFAQDPNLYSWEDIANDMDVVSKKKKTLYLLKFLRYHFIDNSIYISGNAFNGLTYDTGARNDYNKFHKVMVSSNGNNLTIKGEGSDVEANVVTSGTSYNLMARDIIVDNADYTKANNITASNKVAIHLIDKALKF